VAGGSALTDAAEIRRRAAKEARQWFDIRHKNVTYSVMEAMF
jgi:hypothetical protein